MMASKNIVWGLLALAAGAGLAAVLMPPARSRWNRRTTSEDDSARVDEASEDSFPASDPPSYSGHTAATPGPVS
jgi:hypothetical protein